MHREWNFNLKAIWLHPHLVKKYHLSLDFSEASLIYSAKDLAWRVYKLFCSALKMGKVLKNRHKNLVILKSFLRWHFIKELIVKGTTVYNISEWEKEWSEIAPGSRNIRCSVFHCSI